MNWLEGHPDAPPAHPAAAVSAATTLAPPPAPAASLTSLKGEVPPMAGGRAVGAPAVAPSSSLPPPQSGHPKADPASSSPSLYSDHAFAIALNIARMEALDTLLAAAAIRDDRGAPTREAIFAANRILALSIHHDRRTAAGAARSPAVGAATSPRGIELRRGGDDAAQPHVLLGEARSPVPDGGAVERAKRSETEGECRRTLLWVSVDISNHPCALALQRK